ncbi:hypothetical protein SAMN05421878_11122 [Actinobaculum suis]|uniref:Uncharacterized protein n=1 Tax=Actinobaculum suis TaxID=1657 RepID=A0A1G7DG67_9ACTO|nr:hypothetical protein [Actinobaculum suis]SDE50523.1 hypothetical protein SAMN05421878_11122 [Actinobaculum suis]
MMRTGLAFYVRLTRIVVLEYEIAEPEIMEPEVVKTAAPELLDAER